MNRRNFFSLLGLGVLSTKIEFTEDTPWNKWSITDDCNKPTRNERSNSIIVDEYSGCDITFIPFRNNNIFIPIPYSVFSGHPEIENKIISEMFKGTIEWNWKLAADQLWENGENTIGSSGRFRT